MNAIRRFEHALAEQGLRLQRGQFQTLQVNVGRKCNQACSHCHVDAAPWRTDMMSADVARRVAQWIEQLHTGDHCLACTAGCGSSCTGAVS